LKSKNIDNLNISIHNINYSALQKISYGNCETLAYYRQSQKSTMYYSKDFDGNVHPFKPDCLSVNNQLGERRIDKIAFLAENGDYIIGNDIDKLLSGAKILYDPNKKIQFIIEQLLGGGSVAKHLIDRRNKHHQPLDINKEDIGPLLFRYERFSDETKESIKNKTTKYLTNELNKQKQPNYIFNKMLLSKNNSR